MAESPYIIEVTEENFISVVLEGSRAAPVLVDFWAEWCQPCKALMPMLAKLAEEYQGKFILAKLNTEDQQNLAAQFGIRSIPTVKLYKDGEPADEFMGALPESEVRAFLDRHIPRESDKLVAEAEREADGGDLQGGIALVERAMNLDPENPRVRIALARLRARLGELAEADAIIAALPADVQMSDEVKRFQADLVFHRVLLDAAPVEQLEQAVAAGEADSEQRYRLAAYRVNQEDYAEALELLLGLLQTDRKYGDDAGRKGMLAVFEILGGEGDLVAQYRSRMFNALH